MNFFVSPLISIACGDLFRCNFAGFLPAAFHPFAWANKRIQVRQRFWGNRSETGIFGLPVSWFLAKRFDGAMPDNPVKIRSLFGTLRCSINWYYQKGSFKDSTKPLDLSDPHNGDYTHPG